MLFASDKSCITGSRTLVKLNGLVKKNTAAVVKYPRTKWQKRLGLRPKVEVIEIRIEKRKVNGKYIDVQVPTGKKHEIQREKSWYHYLFGLPGALAINWSNNIVTDQGDALLCDALSTTPARTLPNNANAEIEVGTGFVSAIKGRTGVTTGTGSPEAMDATFPKQKGAWGAANDNVLQYQSTFEAGDLNASGIDEAALGNGTDNLAYAEVSPNINMTVADSLIGLWEITFLGA